MFKKVTKLLGAIALTGWMGVANATLIFDFSWDSAGGQIIGVIEGLEDVIGSQSARSVTLISANNDALNIDYADFTSPDINVWNNAFSVVNGEIGVVEFYADTNKLVRPIRSITHFYMRSGCPCDMPDYSGGYAEWYSEDYVGRHAATALPRFERRVTVPEPSTVILLSLGLAGLSLVRYRKQS